MDEVRVCCRCKVSKPLVEFSKNKNNPLGREYKCRICNAVRSADWRKKNPEKFAASVLRYQRKYPERAKAATYRWRDKNYRRYKDLRIKGRYGLEVGDYEKMLDAQNGCCAICKTAKPVGNRRFHVDHCHATNKVRGLLCSVCNLGIGQFKHDPVILQTAIDYLLKSGPAC